MSPGDRSESRGLVGRDQDLATVSGFVMKALEHGGALVIEGEAGVGKTALLDAVVGSALETGARVLRATGAEFEANVSFSGLHQLLLPVVEEVETLGEPFAAALRAALGFGGEASDQLVLYNAAMELLRQLAIRSGALVVVDDLPWLDRSSAGVLAFIARRLAGSQVALIGTERVGLRGFLDSAGLARYELSPLDDDAAEELLQSEFPQLVGRVRQRVINESEGNPLALLELAAGLSDPQKRGVQSLPSILPVTSRLQTMFESRLAGLPPSTRWPLLLAALEETGRFEALCDPEVIDDCLDQLAPAELAGLIAVDSEHLTLKFRHTLVRSAVVALASTSELRRAHRTLAERVGEQTDRRAWHLAQSVVGPDESIALQLEDAAQRSLGRGDSHGAVAAMVRASDLSASSQEAGRRLSEAAALAVHWTGDVQAGATMMRRARSLNPDVEASLAAAPPAAFMLMLDGDAESAHQILVGAINAYVERQSGTDDALIFALNVLHQVCMTAGRPEWWPRFKARLDRLDLPATHPLRLQYNFSADPVRTATSEAENLETAIAALNDDAEHWAILALAVAAIQGERTHLLRRTARRLIEKASEAGSVQLAVNLSLTLSHDDFLRGSWQRAREDLERNLATALAVGDRWTATGFRYRLAVLAAAQGDDVVAQTVADELFAWGQPRDLKLPQWMSHHALALMAIGRRDNQSALYHLSEITPPGQFRPYVLFSHWLVLDVVEATFGLGLADEARSHVEAAQKTELASLSPRLALHIGGASALVSSDAASLELFDVALSVPRSQNSPFDYARVQLLYGERLRRLKETNRARVVLSSARDTFRRLGATPWQERAEIEMRAAGIKTSRSAAVGDLTPQELEIASLAASGLTNKEIGQRLFMSPRTVGSHLYKVFPKLGITTRAALRDALGGEPSR